MKQNVNPKNLNEIKAISYFATSLGSKESIEDVLWDITKNVIHQLGFVDCVIYELDHEKNILVQRAAYGTKNPQHKTIYNQITIEVGIGIVGSVAKNRKPELIPNTKYDIRYIVDDCKRLSEICVPIIINDSLFGVIDSEHPNSNFYNERHLHLLTIIAALCSQKVKELRGQNKKPLTKANEYFKKLERLMKFQKIYQNPNLSLSSVANLLGISACYLSSLVNTASNTSFINYINKYRVSEAKCKLHSNHYAHYTIVSVGLEAGFNSKSAFYNAFKKHTGLTPSAYQQSQLILS
ncbi:AraC-like DNA-binding protein [Saonia flava]|uniref:AraC-like DNA-binding protein n=1 Tax=Saonia flava TaxID=523696 RepID=A0A846QRD4_9FLAO|nr:helix-turn-helix domain-containing protein [Saonia flava]NJB71576.1 AraC-like DNA-binding protein [Saonia flava]